MSESPREDKNNQIPAFYKKKESHTRSKTIAYKFLVPLLVFVFAASVFFFWKWLFFGIGINPDQIKAMLFSPVLAERRSAVLEWGQGVRVDPAKYPVASDREIVVVDQLVKAQVQDPQLVNAAFWVASTYSDSLAVENIYCDWLRLSQNLEPKWVAENLVPVQGFIQKMPCLDLFEGLHATSNPEILWSLATIFGKAKSKGIESVESLFESTLGSGDLRISLLAGIPVWENPVYQGTVEQKAIQFLESVAKAKTLNHQDKIIVFEIFARISQNPGVIKSDELKNWIRRFADEAVDLSIRDRAIKLRKLFAATQ